MTKEYIDEYWDDGILYQVYKNEDGEITADEIEMSEYEYLHGEEDPNDTGEYYTEWMPRYGGYQPDDND